MSKVQTFAFGKNWQGFLAHLNDDRVRQAEQSLLHMLNRNDLNGVRLLDAGCGSGLFSLAAMRLGAAEVVSFDLDQDSVNCARQLNEIYGPFPHWHITQGSALDHSFLQSLGQFDIVYSWGVLHHTGAMWQALDNITLPVASDGTLFVSIYNDQGRLSKFWGKIKAFYNHSPRPIRLLLVATYFALMLSTRIVSRLVHQRPFQGLFLGSTRGMHLWHDAADWVGGYPFETAKPEALFCFFRARKFSLREMRLKQGSGCNEFVFTRDKNNSPN